MHTIPLQPYQYPYTDLPNASLMQSILLSLIPYTNLVMRQLAPYPHSPSSFPPYITSPAAYISKTPLTNAKSNSSGSNSPSHSSIPSSSSPSPFNAAWI